MAGVTCDKCGILFHNHMDPDTYDDRYGKPEGDLCAKCRGITIKRVDKDGNQFPYH